MTPASAAQDQEANAGGGRYFRGARGFRIGGVESAGLIELGCPSLINRN